MLRVAPDNLQQLVLGDDHERERAIEKQVAIAKVLAEHLVEGRAAVLEGVVVGNNSAHGKSGTDSEVGTLPETKTTPQAQWRGLEVSREHAHCPDTKKAPRAEPLRQLVRKAG